MRDGALPLWLDLADRVVDRYRRWAAARRWEGARGFGPPTTGQLVGLVWRARPTLMALTAARQLEQDVAVFDREGKPHQLADAYRDRKRLARFLDQARVPR